MWEKISQVDLNINNNISIFHGLFVEKLFVQQTRILLDDHLHPRNKVVENKVYIKLYITVVNAVVLCICDIYCIFLSIPGRKIPHMWFSFMFLHFPKKGFEVFLTWFDGLTEDVKTVQLLKASEANKI